MFELLVIAIACVQKYIFYEKKAKTKKIILTPCAIKLSFIRHGFCHSQQVCLHIISVFFLTDIYSEGRAEYNLYVSFYDYTVGDKAYL